MANAPTYTRREVRQAIIKRLYRGKHPVISNFTGTASSAGAIRDTILSPAALDRDYTNAWIYISGDAGAGPAIGEVARVTDADFDNDELNVKPDFNAIPISSDEYEIHYNHHPDVIHDLIDEILENLEHSILLPLTDITDGDMETIGVTNWLTSSALVTKSTTTVLHGGQSLKVTANSTPGVAMSPSTRVVSGDTYLVSTDVFVDAAGSAARMILIDVTNSNAEIEFGRTEVQGWSRIQFVAAIPATCERVQIWLECVTQDDVAFFDHVILQHREQKMFDFPSQPEYSFDLKKIFYFPSGAGLSTALARNNFKLFQEGPTFWSHFTVERDETAVVPYRIVVDNATDRHPLWVEADVDFPKFAGDTDADKDADTTRAPLILLRNLVVAEIFEAMADDAHMEENTEHAIRLVRRARELREKAFEIREWRRPESLITGAKSG